MYYERQLCGSLQAKACLILIDEVIFLVYVL